MSLKDLILSLNLSSKTSVAIIVVLLSGISILAGMVMDQKKTIVYQTIKSEDEKVINTIKESFSNIDNVINKKLTIIRKENSSIIKSSEERIKKHVDRKIDNIKDGMEVMMDKIPLSQTEMKLLKKLLDKKEADESYIESERTIIPDMVLDDISNYTKYNLSYMSIDTAFFIKTLKPFQNDTSIKVKKNSSLINKLFGKKKYIKNN